MDAKRRRLEGSSPSTSGQSTASSSPSTSKVLVTKENLTSSDVTTRLHAVQELKKQLTHKNAVKAFVNPENSELFRTVLDMFQKKSAELDQEGAAFPPELKYVIGIIANCCFYSTQACLEMKQNHIRFNAIAAKLFEFKLTPVDSKYSLLRLIANMCVHKEAALSISTSSALLDQIVKQLESEHTLTVQQTIRCLEKLVGASLWRPVLQASVGFYLGKLVASRTGKILNEAVNLLLTVSRRNVRDLGLQVASSDCAEKLLELFFGGNETVQQLVVRLGSASPDVRDKFGEKGAIQKIADDEQFHIQPCCNLLSAFAQDAWGRAALRTSGALDVLISRLSQGCSPPEKMNLVVSLKHFIHDNAGIAHLASSRLFVDMVVRDVEEYIKENAIVCKPAIEADDDRFRADSPLLMEIETNLKSRRSFQDEPEQLHKDFFSLWGCSPSPSQSMSSGNLSLPSSGAGSPSWSGSPEQSSQASIAGSFQRSEREQEDGSDMSESGRIIRTIIDSELWLISWQTQEDRNLPHLIRKDLVEVILSYLSLAPRPDFRVARALRRISGFREGLDQLIEMEFHTRVQHKLCDTPCRKLRNARRCSGCDRRNQFGREILKEFSLHVDSDFGNSYLSRKISSPDFDTRTKAAIAKVSLIKSTGRKIRLSIGQKNAVEILLNSLRTLVLSGNFDQTVSESTYTGGPPLCVQIVGALSSITPVISPFKLDTLFDIDAVFVPSELVECKISTDEPENPEDFLKFEEDGQCLAYISLKDACDNSGYFQGMFSTNLVEKMSGQRLFKFDMEREACSADDFTRFLHWLAGCRDECTRVRTTKTCLALIELSDRYLCPSLSEWICSPHGPTSRLISGESLTYLFPAALTTNMHPRFMSACFATLMRFANAQEITDLCLVVHKTPVIQEPFFMSLRAFMTRE